MQAIYPNYFKNKFIMNTILIYLKLLSRELDSGNILWMHYHDYMALYYYGSCQVCQIDKLLYDEYGKEKLWLYMDNGYIEKFVWDGVRGCYIHR